MKKSLIRLSGAFVSSLMALCSCNVVSHTQTAPDVHLSNYKTFAWSKNIKGKKTERNDRSLVDNQIKSSVTKELQAKGWTENDQNPDVIMDYTIALQSSVHSESSPVYSYPHTQYYYAGRGCMYSLWYPSAVIGYRNYNVPYKDDELTINMIDAKTNQHIWQGWADSELNRSHLTGKEVSSEVRSIFRKFHYPD